MIRIFRGRGAKEPTSECCVYESMASEKNTLFISWLGMMKFELWHLLQQAEAIMATSPRQITT
jgi:hypothetical protein